MATKRGRIDPSSSSSSSSPRILRFSTLPTVLLSECLSFLDACSFYSTAGVSQRVRRITTLPSSHPHGLVLKKGGIIQWFATTSSHPHEPGVEISVTGVSEFKFNFVPLRNFCSAKYTVFDISRSQCHSSCDSHLLRVVTNTMLQLRKLYLPPMSDHGVRQVRQKVFKDGITRLTNLQVLSVDLLLDHRDLLGLPNLTALNTRHLRLADCPPDVVIPNLRTLRTVVHTYAEYQLIRHYGQMPRFPSLTELMANYLDCAQAQVLLTGIPIYPSMYTI